MIRRMVVCLLCLVALTAPPSVVRAQDDGQNRMTVHVVQRGDTLFKIAQRYGTTIESIAQANGISDVTLINVGQRLLIPNAATANPGIPTDYLVQPADSLRSIALRFGTTVDEVARRNLILNPRQMFAGLSLALQEGSTGNTGVKTGWLHTVTPTDNLYRIAARYGVPQARIVRANNLRRDWALVPGQSLLIPGDAAPPLIDLPAPYTRLALEPALLEQGRTVILRLRTAMPTSMSGTFMDRPLVMVTDPQRQDRTVIFGVPPLARPGVYPLSITATDEVGQTYPLTRLIEVRDGGYPSETLTLVPELSDLINPAVTQPEADRVAAMVGRFTPERFYGGPMGLPCSAAVTSQYGTRRSYNGSAFDFVHTGTDFAGAPGSPIIAPAAGVVVLSEPLTVRGNAVIMDHGWGIFTGYWHMQQVNVRVGEAVQPGQLLGTVGSTGRVTGYHLHWELFVHGVPVDPLQWVRQTFF
jgi:murein DD-endopeptidase MepM/ murein hydrolase activator NlpD